MIYSTHCFLLIQTLYTLQDAIKLIRVEALLHIYSVITHPLITR